MQVIHILYKHLYTSEKKKEIHIKRIFDLETGAREPI